MAGLEVGSLFGAQRPGKNIRQFGAPSTYNAAVNTQGSDYDRIMQQYKDFASNASNSPSSFTPVNYTPIAANTTQYEQSQDVTDSLDKLKVLADTGGYSDSDISNIRERDISPIRSIYANAQQEVERQKSLSGGYSPNFNAIMSEMSRDQANKISDVTTKANADIAERVASGKLAAASPYASASASANAAKAAADQKNADIINQINEMNSQMKERTDEYNSDMSFKTQNQNKSNILNAIEGMRSLYGTNPALINTFGNQVVQAGQLGQNQQQINNNQDNNRFSFAARFGRS